MSPPKPPATLSLDLDNLWAYLRVHGDPGWEAFPSYLDLVVPRILGLLAERRLQITFFIVGQDAALEKNREALAQISAAGHEIASHSFHHRPSLAQQPDWRIEKALALAEESIEGATGRCPRGFRGPAFCASTALLGVLRQRGYLYDSSSFPTFIGPLARFYYQSTVKRRQAGADERENLYGHFRDGFGSLAPFHWQLPGGELLCIPVTTFPLVRTPIHLTYLLYLLGISRRLALSYFEAATRFCRTLGIAPTLLLHPLDFLGRNDVTELAYFPGMQFTGEEKTRFVADVLDSFCAIFAPLPLAEFAQGCAGRKLRRIPAPL